MFIENCPVPTWCQEAWPVCSDCYCLLHLLAPLLVLCCYITYYYQLSQCQCRCPALAGQAEHMAPVLTAVQGVPGLGTTTICTSSYCCCWWWKGVAHSGV